MQCRVFILKKADTGINRQNVILIVGVLISTNGFPVSANDAFVAAALRVYGSQTRIFAKIH